MAGRQVRLNLLFLNVMSYLTKICGITSIDDALMVSSAGADYLGVLVNVPQSPRSVNQITAAEIVTDSNLPVIILKYNHDSELVLDDIKTVQPAGVQLAGNENEDYIIQLREKITCELWKSIHISTSDSSSINSDELIETIQSYHKRGADKIILDSAVRKEGTVHQGGTGQCFDWSLAKKVKEHLPDVCLFLAGGINPDNITDALLQVSPDGIDLSSGVEAAVGKKSPELVKRLITNIKNLEASLQ